MKRDNIIDLTSHARAGARDVFAEGRPVLPLAARPELAGRPELSNERADVARRILELSETVAEAIDYLRAKTVSAPDGSVAVILKDIGEGLMSLENAVSSISGPSGSDPEDVHRLAEGFDELTECLDSMIDAYLEGRTGDFARLTEGLDETFAVYGGGLTRCFRGLSIN